MCYSGSPGLARRCGCGLIEIEKYIRYAPRAAGLKPSAMQDEARLRGLFQTTRHPCASVISVPIRVLFRLSEAKPACAGATLLVRAEALPEHGEAPAGLARGRSCGLKPLSTWKPLRTIVRFRHQDAQTPPSPRVGEGGGGDEGQKARNAAHRALLPRTLP